MTTPPVPPTAPVSDVSSDDRLWVVLCFLFTPLIPVITLFLDDKKNKPFIKYHNVPALILGIVIGIAIGLLTIIPFVGCISPLLWIINIIFAVKAYKGVNVDIPVITNFSKQQGWS
jgi:uncharacterized membrane protein